MKIYKHSIAAYPTKVFGIVPRKENLCMQFERVKLVNKIAYKDDSDLLKMANLELYQGLPITPSGVQVQVLATRMEFNNLIDLQMQLAGAYKTYVLDHKNPDITLMVYNLRNYLDNIIINNSTVE